MAGNTVNLKFIGGFGSPTFEVAHGDYVRKFAAEDQPFEATEAEHHAHLTRTGVFEVVVSEPAAQQEADSAESALSQPTEEKE